MRVDTGLQDGVGALRQNNQLLDLTLKAGGQEFRAHKVVLASVSDDFRALLCELPKESKRDILELKDVTGEQISKLVDFIYAEDKTGVKGDQQKKIPECAVNFKVNTEIQDGVGALRQGNQLSDLTLKVDGQEFRVHRVILASVSDYFRAMLCGSLKDSASDIVELNGISAMQVSKLLDFIYTGDNDALDRSPKEMLECGVYFQMPKLIQECTEMLLKSLSFRNCLEQLSIFQKFALDETTQQIKSFVKVNLRKVIDHYEPEDMTLEVIQVAVQNWKKSEWELFNFVNSWISLDLEKRAEHRNDFLGQVRYKLMTPEEISAVKETTVFTDTKGLWKLLVDESAAYHQLPIHQKVLDKSIQNHARHSKSAFVMDTHPYSASDCPSSRAHILCKPDKVSGMQGWKSCPDVKPPPVGEQFVFVMEVNNFLIACSEADHSTQHWLIFDPRTLMWHEMAAMPRPRDSFAAVYHKKRIYVLGGYGSAPIDTIEEYSFETGSWTSNKKLPIPVADHAACVLKDAIYVSGGRINTPPFQIPRVDSMDLVSQKWQSKAPMLQLKYRRTTEHKMFTMKIKGKEAIVVIYRGLWMDCYDPDTDQWSDLNFSVPELKSAPKVKDRSLKPVKDIFQNSTGEVIVYGNTLFWLSIGGDLYNDRHSPEHCLCVKWIIPHEKDKSDIVEIRLGDDPLRYEKRSDYFEVVWGMVAFPPRSATKA